MWFALITQVFLFYGSTYASSPFYKDTLEVEKSPVSHEDVSRDTTQLAANALSLAVLDRRLEVLREKLQKVSQFDHERLHRETAARLTGLEGPVCEKDGFECGLHTGECIYDLFVCDGRKDCSNGYDEDEAVCSIEPALAGITYTGTAHWTSCETRDDHPMNITILGYRIRKYSSSIVWLKALIESTFKRNGRQVRVTHTAIGHYKFANRQMVLLGEGVGRSSGAYCNFNKGDNKRAKCDLVNILSLDHCATIYLTLDE